MKEEFPLPLNKMNHSVKEAAAHFKNLVDHVENKEPAFNNLEEILFNNGFMLALHEDVSSVLNDNSLICRSEEFGLVLDLIAEEKPINIENGDGHANMCKMFSGDGFRIAMQEGFSGRDVGGLVKTVLVFRGNSLKSQKKITLNDQLWELKPETAQVSLAGSGQIELDDIEMISFRLPVTFFPENLLTEQEQDLLENQNIKFIVRHYIKVNKKTVH